MITSLRSPSTKKLDGWSQLTSTTLSICFLPPTLPSSFAAIRSSFACFPVAELLRGRRREYKKRRVSQFADAVRVEVISVNESWSGERRWGVSMGGKGGWEGIS